MFCKPTALVSHPGWRRERQLGILGDHDGDKYDGGDDGGHGRLVDFQRHGHDQRIDIGWRYVCGSGCDWWDDTGKRRIHDDYRDRRDYGYAVYQRNQHRRDGVAEHDCRCTGRAAMVAEDAFLRQGWETGTSASQAVDMIEELQPVQGATNPSGNLTWSSSVNGAAYGALMTLTSAGNVGIGTALPAAPLNVMQAGSNDALRISRSGLADASFTLSTPVSDTVLEIGNPSVSKFQTVFDLVTGYVGIGTTSPGYPLRL